MAKIIIIRGKKDSGKTTTAGLLYIELLKKSEKGHVFNNKNVKVNSLEYNTENGDLIDFNAIIKIKEKTIGIISAGDIVDDLKAQLSIFIEINIDIIICCSRSRNIEGSAYKMILKDFAKQNPILKEVWVKFSSNIEEKESIKIQPVEEITNLIISNIQ